MDPIASTDSIEIVKLSHENLLVGTYFDASLQIVNDNHNNKKKTVIVVEANEETKKLVRSIQNQSNPSQLTPEVLQLHKELSLTSDPLVNTLSQSLSQHFQNHKIKSRYGNYLQPLSSSVAVNNVEELLKENSVVVVGPTQNVNDYCVFLLTTLHNASLSFVIPAPGIFTCDPQQFPSNATLVNHFYFPEV